MLEAMDNEEERQRVAKEKAVAELADLNGDREASHGRADEILLEYLDAIGEKRVADAFRDARGRVGFWYS